MIADLPNDITTLLFKVNNKFDIPTIRITGGYEKGNYLTLRKGDFFFVTESRISEYVDYVIIALTPDDTQKCGLIDSTTLNLMILNTNYNTEIDKPFFEDITKLIKRDTLINNILNDVE